MNKLDQIISNIKKEYINFQYDKKRDIKYIGNAIKQIKNSAVEEDINDERKLYILENSINKIKKSNDNYNNRVNLEYLSNKILDLKNKFEETWESEHIPKAEKINKAIERGISTPVLTVCGKGTREIRYTKYLAYYLDPNNFHGLGSEFLESVIDPIIKESYDSVQLNYKNVIKVTPEEYIGTYISKKGLKIGCTCDIVIEGRDFAIFIEQKLLSAEDYNNAADIRQLERYTQVINENIKYRDKKKFKIFLTPKGKDAKRSDDWISVSHMDLIGNSIKYLTESNLNNTTKENLKSLLIDLVIGPYEDSSDLLFQIKESTSKLLSKKIKIQDVLTFKNLVKENGELIKIITEV
jgi:hypothetical protein